MNRPDWLKEGCRVIRDDETGTVGGMRCSAGDTPPVVFWVNWDDRAASYGSLDHWLEVLGPLVVEPGDEPKAFGRVSFVAHGTGKPLQPDIWDGRVPEVDQQYTVDGAVYNVVDVAESKTFGTTVTLHICITDAPITDAPDTKDTNPKDAVGIKKAPLSVIPAPFLHAVGLGMMEGALKYGRHNYRPAGIRYSVYYDAAMRHLTAWWEGEDIDQDSGLPHPIKAACCMAVLFDAMVQENGTDDRPPKSPPEWLAEMNRHAADLVEKYPNPKAPFTEL